MVLDHLPDSSEFKKASDRGGRQSRAERVAEDHYNETAMLRASFHVAHGGKDAAYEPRRYLDPIDEKIRAEREAAQAAEDAEAAGDFDAAIGYSA